MRDSEHERDSDRQRDGVRRGREEFASWGERLLGWIGVAFLLLGLVFFLRLAFDRGWISPALRLGAGYLGTVALLGFGLRLERRRPALAEGLLGGGVAAFYLVTYGGYELYGLIAGWLAVRLMTAGTALTFLLSDRQRTPALAIIATIGGLSTPFVIPVRDAGLGALSLYIAGVLVAGGIVYARRGWWQLQAVLAGGGALVTLFVAVRAGGEGGALQGIALLAYLAVAVVIPLLRPLFLPSGVPLLRNLRSLALILFAAAISVGAAAGMFGLSLDGTGVLTLALAGSMGGLAYASRQTPATAVPAAILASIAVAFGIVFVVWGPAALPLLMVEVAVLHALVRRGGFRALGVVAHLVALGIVLGFLGGLAAGTSPGTGAAPGWVGPGGGAGGAFALSQGAWLRLLTIAMTPAVMRVAGPAADGYGWVAYAALLVWSGTELSPLTNGPALVTIAWTLQGAATLLYGMGRVERLTQIIGLATLGLVAVKLVLVDLAQLDAVWRILLSMGFGLALLGLGYVVNRPGAKAERQ